MVEGLHAVAQLAINENNVSEMNINFINENNQLAGCVDVDAKGNMSWEIIDLKYKRYFMNVLPYLYNKSIDNRISYKSTSPDTSRWIRTRMYLANNKVPIKYGQELLNFQDSNKMSR